MKRALSYYFYIIIFIILAASSYCFGGMVRNYTKITAVKDNSLSVPIYYNIFITAAGSSSLEHRKVIEETFAYKLLKNVKAHSSLVYMFPDRKYSGDEYKEILKSVGADAVLRIVTSFDTSGNDSKIELLDISKEKLVWIATAITNIPDSSSFATTRTQRHTTSSTETINKTSFNSLVEDLADETIKQMSKDGLIPNE